MSADRWLESQTAGPLRREVEWGMSFCDEDQVDEYFESRGDAEAEVDALRGRIARGEVEADLYEPIVIVPRVRWVSSWREPSLSEWQRANGDQS